MGIVGHEEDGKLVKSVGISLRDKAPIYILRFQFDYNNRMVRKSCPCTYLIKH
jgi:hypothetical protein